jgi:outer membrane immunogenic protein
MNKIRFLAGTAVAAVMTASSVQAADLGPPLKAPPPPPPVFSWTGCHVGGNLGLGAIHTTWQDTVPDGNIDNELLFLLVGIDGPSTRTATGGVAGGQLGCDWQFAGNWVVGIAGSVNWSDVSATGMDQFNNTWTLRDGMDWFSTVTGRVGFTPINTALIYGKGGAVFAHNNFEIENSGVTLGTPSEVITGWTVGAGVEWAFSPSWSIFLEGNYYGLPTRIETFNNPIAVANAFVNPPFTINVKPSFETVTFGVNFRFWGDGARF